MLDVARQYAQREGFVDRCTFHAGYLSSLDDALHHAATSILVSHFLTDADARRAYFADIAARLRPGGLLFNVDLCADQDRPDFAPLLDLWIDHLDYSGTGPPDGNAGYGFGRLFAVHGPAEVEQMLRDAGFDDLLASYQFVVLRGWFARKPDSSAPQHTAA